VATVVVVVGGAFRWWSSSVVHSALQLQSGEWPVSWQRVFWCLCFAAVLCSRRHCTEPPTNPHRLSHVNFNLSEKGREEGAQKERKSK
jgi:hypothetical protein